MTENYLADVQITPRAGILDPVGETIANALGNLGYEDVRSVRAGRLIRLEIAAETAQDAQTAVESMCEELIANPELVRTMSVQPPTDAGSIRVIGISDVDLQPCGGTHVKTTAEIGRVRIGKIENKGKHNRRINVHLEE